MRRKTVGLFAVFAVLAMPVVAQQRVLNVAVGGAFTSMDPHFFNLGPNNVLTSYVFEPLTRFDPKFRPEPSLAVAWKPVDDTTWEFKLRDGVKFTDGTPFTADDVVFTFARVPTILNSPSSFMFAVKPITKLKVVDDHTIRMHTVDAVQHGDRPHRLAQDRRWCQHERFDGAANRLRPWRHRMQRRQSFLTFQRGLQH
jgi:peptide/nickel transport system substrate-binding protein